MNHHLEKERSRYGIAFGGLPSREARKPTKCGGSPILLYAASFSASSSFGLLLFKVRMGLLLLQIRCWASF